MSGANPVDPIGSAAGDFSPGVVSPLGEFNIFGGVEGTDGNCFKISAVGLGVPPRFVGEALMSVLTKYYNNNRFDSLIKEKMNI